MLRSEFDSLLEAAKITRRPTDKEYELIEFVYNWHPCNFDKEAVASLYADFGMAIFYDMEDRSKAAMEREQSIRQLDQRIKELVDLREKLLKDTLEGRMVSND